MKFVKAEANGNDFLIVDAAAVAPAERSAFTRRICDRHRGVGADGVEFVSPHGAGFALTLYNADGSEAEISGNGTRCVAAFYAKHGFRGGVLETAAGPREARVIEGADNHWKVEIGLGVPQITGMVSLPHHGDVFVLSTGNPQCIVFCDEFPADWQDRGAALERDAYFPRRTNVEFVRVVSSHRLEIRIFERGVGPTHSSGTGSAAAAVAAIARGLADSPVEVKTPGGTQTVAWGGSDTAVRLIGPATIVAEGIFLANLS